MAMGTLNTSSGVQLWGVGVDKLELVSFCLCGAVGPEQG